MVKKNTKSNYLYLVFVLFSLQSCVSHYVPSIAPAVALSEKKEINLTGAISLSGALAANAQAAYALSNHVGTYTQFSRFNSEPKVFDSLNQWKRGTYFEFGTGYFSKFGSYGLFEVYPSYGQGYIVNQYTETNTNLNNSNFLKYAGSSRLEYQKFGLSTGIGYKGKMVEVFYHLRVNSLVYTSFKSLNMSDINLKNKLAELQNKKIPIVESAFTLRFGFENVKLVLQAGIPMNSLSDIPNNTPAYISSGVHVTFNK